MMMKRYSTGPGGGGGGQITKRYPSAVCRIALHFAHGVATGVCPCAAGEVVSGGSGLGLRACGPWSPRAGPWAEAVLQSKIFYKFKTPGPSGSQCRN